MFNQKLIALLVLPALLFTAACSTSTSAPADQTTPTSQPTTGQAQAGGDQLSPCPKFSDAPNPDDAETNYVLYRDFLKANNWDRAFALWRQVYAVSPAADGRRNTVYADGIRLYEHAIQTAQDSMLKKRYVDTIFMIYDQIQECYPEGGYISARKAFDMYYKYPNRADSMQLYNMFKQAIDTDKLKAPDFVVNPFAALLVELYASGKVPESEARTYGQQLLDIVDNGLKNCKGEECERWKVIESYAPARLEYFETIQGFYDCEYYIEKYYPEFQESPQDCDVIRTVYSRLKWGGCNESNAQLTAVAAAGNENCREAASAGGIVGQAYDALQNGQYRRSVELFEQAAREADDATRKGNYLLTIAKIYYAHLKSFSQARNYARQAANARGGWGEPYLLIGRLYASSGPLCGPGRGWDSQVVVWAAIDMWQRARSVDPGAAAEANRLINRYTQYMPNKEDIFQRSLRAGQSYYVGCWIQENTTIRTSD